MNGESDMGRQEWETLNGEGIVGKQICTENSYMQETRSLSLKPPRKCPKTGVSESNFPLDTARHTRNSHDL